MDRRKIIIIAVAMFSIVIISILAIFVLRSKSPVKPGLSGSTAPSNKVNEKNNASAVVEKKRQVEQNTLDSLARQVEEVGKNDQDLDGLSDVEEAKSGTSPTSSDTDNDGLLDRDEIMIYHTDPLKKDTDGDGLTDGHEVLRGLNPLGTGSLLLPASSSSTASGIVTNTKK
jgi:Bacterial TSP3 repeat